MTLIVGVTTADGIVMASHSRTSFVDNPNTGQPMYRVLSDYTQKLVVADSIAISTAGWAFLSSRNIAAHLKDFGAKLHGQSKTPHQVAVELETEFRNHMTAHTAATGEAPQPGVDVLIFLVAGYENGKGVVLEVGLPLHGVTQVLDTDGSCGYVLRGQTDVFDRLMKGVDLDRLMASATAAGKQQSVNGLAPELQSLGYRVRFPLLNLQDAVDFAVLAIRTTIDVQRLTSGTLGNPGAFPGVGGPIEIVSIDAQGVREIQRSQLKGERSAGVAEKL